MSQMRGPCATMRPSFFPMWEPHEKIIDAKINSEAFPSDVIQLFYTLRP